MSRHRQILSGVLFLLHLGVPVALQADHHHFLGSSRNTEQHVTSDSCCPAESHRPLDANDRCSLCQRALTSFGIFTLQSIVPEHAGQFVCEARTRAITPQFFEFGNPRRGPPAV